MKRTDWSFILGSCFIVCAYGLTQDWMGREAFIASIVRAYWVESPWWIWLFPIVAILIIEGRLSRKER